MNWWATNILAEAMAAQKINITMKVKLSKYMIVIC